MSSHINFTGLSGNLGSDANMTPVGNGRAKIVFNLANNREYRQDGETKKQVSWLRCVWFTNENHGVIPYLKKGKLVYVQGRIEAREYEQEGQRKTITEIVVNDLQLMSDGSQQREPVSVGASNSFFEDDDQPVKF